MQGSCLQCGTDRFSDMKICCQCKIAKQFTDFYKNAGKLDGLQGMCKTCTKQNDAQRVVSGVNKKRSRVYYHSITAVKMKDPNFRREHNTYQSRRKRTQSCRRRQRQRYAANLQERLSQTLRTRIRAALATGCPKSKNTLELLGCNICQLKDWLSNKFVKGMSWNNYGEWHIDHIKPCIVFDLTNPIEQQQCFHYSNLQPLWAEDNLKKGSKVIQRKSEGVVW